jgi:hypothetical protein
MRNHWGELLSLAASLAIAVFFLAFCGKVAWRNRRNKFLLVGWFAVLIVFLLLDGLTYTFVMRSLIHP